MPKTASRYLKRYRWSSLECQTPPEARTHEHSEIINIDMALVILVTPLFYLLVRGPSMYNVQCTFQG